MGLKRQGCRNEENCQLWLHYYGSDYHMPIHIRIGHHMTKPCKLAFYGMIPLVVVLVACCLKLEMKITPAKYINCLSVYIH